MRKFLLLIYNILIKILKIYLVDWSNSCIFGALKNLSSMHKLIKLDLLTLKIK